MNTELVNHVLKNYYGLTEIAGPGSNPTILQWIKRFIPSAKDDSTTSWCSIGLSEACREIGCERSLSASARSWLLIGSSTTTPELGDITILWRNNINSWQGHVGIFIRKEGNFIWLLGANQGDSWSIQKFDTKRVLGYRKLKKV